MPNNSYMPDTNLSDSIVIIYYLQPFREEKYYNSFFTEKETKKLEVILSYSIRFSQLFISIASLSICKCLINKRRYANTTTDNVQFQSLLFSLWPRERSNNKIKPLRNPLRWELRVLLLCFQFIGYMTCNKSTRSFVSFFYQRELDLNGFKVLWSLDVLTSWWHHKVTTEEKQREPYWKI